MSSGTPSTFQESTLHGAGARSAIPEDEIRAEQLQHLAQRNQVSARTGLIGLAAVLGSQASSVSWPWLFGFTLLRLLTIWLDHAESRKVLALGGAAALRAGHMARLEWTLFATGLTWGLAAWLLPEHIGDNPAAHFLLLILVAVSGFMLNTTSLSRRAVLLGVGGMWGLVVLRALWLHDPYTPYLIAGSIAYAAALIMHGLRLCQQSREDIVTQLHNRWLYETVQQARLREQAQSGEQARTNQKLASALARAHALATYDDLTGVLNRTAFLSRATGELSAQRRHDEAASVVLVDLDRFKDINDRLGHEVGDELLRRTAAAMQNMLRGADILARWGGEEFLIFMPRTPAEVASMVAERLRQTLHKLDTSGLPEGAALTASFGVTEMLTDMTLEAAIARADRGVYAAKAAGHDRVYVAGTNQLLVEVPRSPISADAPPAASSPIPTKRSSRSDEDFSPTVAQPRLGTDPTQLRPRTVAPATGTRPRPSLDPHPTQPPTHRARAATDPTPTRPRVSTDPTPTRPRPSTDPTPTRPRPSTDPTPTRPRVSTDPTPTAPRRPPPPKT